jgi:hypothetical protein
MLVEEFDNIPNSVGDWPRNQAVSKTSNTDNASRTL